MAEQRTLLALIDAKQHSEDGRPLCRYHGEAQGWVDISRGEFSGAVTRVAAALLRRGLRPGARVAIIADGSPQWLAAEFAAWRAGAVVVGLDPKQAKEQLADQLTACAATVCISDRPAVLRSQAAKQCLLRVAIDAAGESPRPAPNATASAIIPWSTLLEPPVATPGEGAELPTVTAEDLATIVYTSGSTGAPKARSYCHGQLADACATLDAQFPASPVDDTGICWLPLAHLFQRMFNWIALRRSSPISFVNEPQQLPAAIRELGPSTLIGVPRFYEKIYEKLCQRAATGGLRALLLRAALRVAHLRGQALRHGAAEAKPHWPTRAWHGLLDWLVLRRVRAALSDKLRFLVAGSAATPPWLLDFFAGLRLPLLEAYGLSESVLPVALNRPGGSRPGSVGKPLPGIELRLAADGEVLIRSAALCSEVATAGFYASGDIGRLDADGYLYLTGRKSELFKTATGRKIAPAAVEGAYRQSRFIEQVVVFGEGKPFLVALLQLVPGALEQWRRDNGFSWHQCGHHDLFFWDALKRELEDLGEQLSDYQRIAGAALVDAPLSVELGELTPTLKLKRDVIAARYQHKLEELVHAVIRARSSDRSQRGVLLRHPQLSLSVISGGRSAPAQRPGASHTSPVMIGERI